MKRAASHQLKARLATSRWQLAAGSSGREEEVPLVDDAEGEDAVTADQFRNLVLSFPDAEERSHHGHPDFRVGGKIFATLGHPDHTRGMVQLTPEQQAEFLHDHPQVFSPAAGKWGQNGSTVVNLPKARLGVLKPAAEAAWKNALNKAASKKGSRKPTSARQLR